MAYPHPMDDTTGFEEPTREEQEGDAWEYWHQRARKFETALYEITGHLGAAKMQRAPSDDQIIAAHIDAALTIATNSRR